MKRRLLAVAWTMPPLVFPRAIQISRLLKILARNEWDIDVITTEPDSEPSGIQDIAFANRYNEFYKRHIIDTRDLIERQRASAFYNRIEKPTRRFFSASHDLIADGWRARARDKATLVARRALPDVLVTFAQPWIDHLVGTDLKVRYPKLPWVAHFSDPWVDSPYNEGMDPRVLENWRHQERQVIEAADAVVFVTPRTADLVMAKYPSAWRDKVHIVPHGYDRELLPPNSASASGNKRLHIVHTGGFYPGLREPFALLKALERVRERAPAERFPTTEFVGYTSPDYESYARDHGLDDSVRFRRRIGYFDALGIAANADVLVIIDGNSANNVFLPSKTVDYLMLGKPILALTPLEGATADVLAALGHACVAPGDIDAIAAAILRLIDRKSSSDAIAGNLSPPPEFDIERTAARFETAMNTAISAWSVC